MEGMNCYVLKQPTYSIKMTDGCFVIFWWLEDYAAEDCIIDKHGSSFDDTLSLSALRGTISYSAER